MKNNLSGENNNILVRYIGLHGIAQGLEQVVLAARELASWVSIRIELIGDGPEKQVLMQMSKELKVNNLRFRDPVPHKQVRDLLNAADICLVPLKIRLTGAVPSKLYEAMAVGKPVVLVADGEAARIVQDHACGLVVKPGDIRGLSAAIRTLAADSESRRQMGANGRLAAVEYFDRAEIAVRFADFLRVQVDKSNGSRLYGRSLPPSD
jgi:glycosyltransferase involved in cell wall biosynthesis